MKLNAYIIYSRLSRHFRCEMFGPELSEMSLGRPEFYLDGETVFLKNHLYLASIEHLPSRPRIQKGAMMVCIGDGFTLNYYKERMSLIVIEKKQDFLKFTGGMIRIRMF